MPNLPQTNFLPLQDHSPHKFPINLRDSSSAIFVDSDIFFALGEGYDLYIPNNFKLNKCTANFPNSYVINDDDPKSFSLPAPHLFWSKSGKNPPEGGSGGSTTLTVTPKTTAASITSDKSLSLCVGLLIAVKQ